MDEREFEGKLEELLKQDLSTGTEQFRDALLERCLEVMESDAYELDDADLELLSAAGDINTINGWPPAY